MQSFFESEQSRRCFVEHAVKAAFGVTLLTNMDRLAAANTAAPAPKGKRMIYLFMQGAMSHLDSFDPKPDSKLPKVVKSIQTKISGVRFGEHFPKIADMADKFAIVRSMTTTTGNHEDGQYFLRTSYRPIATTVHPGWGSLIHHVDGRMHDTLPASVVISGKGQGPGYLGAKYAPIPIGDPNKGLENTKSPDYVTDSAFKRRMLLAQRFDKTFRQRASSNPEVTGYDELYREAIALMTSDELTVFDLRKEKDAIRDKYGRGQFGQGVLLARRLIENGTRYVEVTLNGWDHHNQMLDGIRDKGPQLDHALSALMEDLESRGLLQETLVVVGTEFGRSPEINQNAGRNHHPSAFSCLLAGGGIKTGQVYGATDEDAFEPDEDPIAVEDFNATIAKSIGLPLNMKVISPDGRPFKIGGGGEPIEKLV